MLTLGYTVSASSSKMLAVKATASKEVASANKQSSMADTSCHLLSKRDLAYFSSERFARTLQILENQQLAREYGRLITSRKRAALLGKAQQIAEAVIYVDIFDAHYDGFHYTYEEVRDLFKGYRSQALRELESARGFNALVYRELAKALGDKREIREFLKGMNKASLRVK